MADLKKIYEWARSSNLEFSADKFELLRYVASQQHQGADAGVRYASSLDTFKKELLMSVKLVCY